MQTIELSLTSDCGHECPYCWGPKDYQAPIGTATALRIVSRVSEVGARRIVFSGGDPLWRSDIRLLILYARDVGLEVVLATTGERLTREFLSSVGPSIDRVCLPLDGSCEAVNSRTRSTGHFEAVLEAMARLRDYPQIEVSVCTVVTRHNVEDVPRILRLVEEYAGTTGARVCYDVFQAFPRAMFPAKWNDLLVSDAEFAALRGRLPSVAAVPVNLRDHAALDRLSVMVFPDGRLVIPRGRHYYTYGRFLEIADLGEILKRSRSDATKHRSNSGIRQRESRAH